LDPFGSPPTENNDQLGNLTDGNDTTRWRTDRYSTAEFGNLKDGLGIVVDLGTAVQLTSVTLATPSQGINYELRIADEIVDPDEWRNVATVTNSGDEAQSVFPEPVTTRYLLIWITAPLVQFDGGWTAAFSGLTVEGIPS
jgi:hypothetical protein